MKKRAMYDVLADVKLFWSL